jgi:O-antigen/teichoic acid export membrane protein
MLRRFLRDSAIYGLAGILVRSVSLLLVPIYTRILSPTDYGIVDLITLFTAFVGVTVALEIGQSLARYLPDADSNEERSAYASAALWFTLAGYAAFTVLAVVFASPLAELLLDSAERRDLVLVALPLVVGSGVFYLLQSQLRFELRPAQYAISGLVYSGIGISASVLLVVVLRIGVAGVFLGQAIGALAGIAVAGAWARRSFRLAVDFDRLREMVRFSLPLVPSSIGVMIALYIDRIAIKELLTLGDLGLYGIGYRVASVVTLLMIGFQGALTPLIYTHYRDPETPGELARIFSFFVTVALGLCLALAVFAGEIVRLAAAPAFWDGAIVVPLLAPAALLATMYVFAPGLSIAKRTATISAINLLGAGLNTGLSFTLVPLLGIRGAAASTLIGAATIFALSMIASQRHYPVPHAWGRIAVAALAAVGIFVVASALPVGAGSSIALKILLVVVAVALCAALGLVDIPRRIRPRGGASVPAGRGEP